MVGEEGSGSEGVAEGVAEGGLATALPAKGLLEEALEPHRLCSDCWAGKTGRLLLVGREGRSSWVGVTTFASVSVRLNVENREGGGGRDPLGLPAGAFRRLSKYCAVSVGYCKLVSSFVKHSFNLDGRGGVCGSGSKNMRAA